MTDKDTQTGGNYTPPPPTPGGGYTNPDQHSFMLQSIMEMQRSIGAMESSINTMTESNREQCKKIDTLGKRFAWAAGAVITALAVGGYFIDKMWDVALPLINQEVAAVSKHSEKDKKD